MKAPNMISYLQKDARLSFREAPFTAVDSLVLSELSYMDFHSIVYPLNSRQDPVPLPNALAALLGGSTCPSGREREFLSVLSACPRFSQTQVNFYCNETDVQSEKQFSAVTFLLEDGSFHVTYRGTDTTLVGWKEDFNMAFLSPVPAQESSVRYLTSIAQRLSGPIRVGGHSKGGNLAVYAAAMCAPALQERILSVYSHDGPGFKDPAFYQHEYRLIQDRVFKYLPQSSVIGMLMANQDTYTVVESTGFGILQHDPFSWIIEDGDFRRLCTVTDSSRFFDQSLNQWINSMDETERQQLTDELYRILSSAQIETFSELDQAWRTALPAALNAVRDSEPETRRFMMRTIRSFFRIALENARMQHPLKKQSGRFPTDS